MGKGRDLAVSLDTWPYFLSDDGEEGGGTGVKTGERLDVLPPVMMLYDTYYLQRYLSLRRLKKTL